MGRMQKSAEAIVAKRQGQCLGHGEGLNFKERKRPPMVLDIR